MATICHTNEKIRSNSPWSDADCRAHRRECHRLERRYRRTYRPDDRRRWVEATRRRFSVYRNKRDE